MSAVGPGALVITCLRYLPRPSRVWPRWTVMPMGGTSQILMVLFSDAWVASASLVQLGKEDIVAQAKAHVLGVRQEFVALMDRGNRGVWMQHADLVDVPTENALLDALCVEEVECQPQDLLALKLRVVCRDDRLQLSLCASGRVVAEQRVEHGHEVALAGAEGTGQE